MKPYNLPRRKFLKTAAAGAVIAPLATAGLWQWLGKSEEDSTLFITASDDKQGNHYISGFNTNGNKRFQLATDMRGHGVAANPVQTNRIVMFARRPGTAAFEADLRQGVITKQIASAPNRHFFGHGCFSRDGRYLYTSENDFENNRGVIVVRDTRDYRILNEFPSYGIGPHELRLLSDDKTLVVANGGIQTHPQYPRKKLNIDTMQPALSYIDSQTDQLLDEYHPPNHKLSIRHLDVSEQDQVIAIMQYQGAKTDEVPLVATHRGEQQLQTMMADDSTQIMMNQYTASACIDSATGIAGVTCPRGDLVTFWNIEQGGFIKSLPVKDAGGITLNKDNQFVITTGRGEVHRISPALLEPDHNPLVLKNTRFDNHLSHAVLA